MRLGVHLGPFYASTSTRRRRGGRSGGRWIAGFFGIVLLIGWPFLFGQDPNGGYHGWVWAIAVPWWILLALVVVAGLLGSHKEAAAKAAADERRIEAARRELASRDPGALEALDKARRVGWVRLDGKTAYAYAGVTPDGHRCHHRHRSPQAAAECAAGLVDVSTGVDQYRLIGVQEAAVMSEFYAYDNHHRDRARVHRSECQWCNHGRGVQGGSSGANDQWHGPFSSAEDAYATVSRRADVSYCAYCRPQS